MDRSRSRPTAHVAGHPVHAALVPFPIVCFTLVLATDIGGQAPAPAP